MNQVIKELYDIEAQAGKLLEEAGASRQAAQEQKKKQMEEISAELEAELEGRVAILKARIEEQAQDEIRLLTERNQRQIKELDETYARNLTRYAKEIVKKITEE